MVAPTAEKAAQAQLVFREVNEHISELRGFVVAGVALFICECGDPECAEAIEVTPAEYEAVRAHPDRFIVRTDHQLPEVERVVARNRRFLVVEKVGHRQTAS